MKNTPVKYVKDCIGFAKKYPLKNGKLFVWLRNVLYINWQR